MFVLHGPLTGLVNIDSADVVLQGAAGDEAGSALSAGDINGDGHHDLVVGTPGYSDGGAAFVVLGPAPASLALTDADAILVGESSGDLAGCAVAADGDLNADGISDLLIGAAGLDDEAGGAVVFYGPRDGTYELDDADIILEGTAPGDTAGTTAAWAGDTNGDLRDDILIGAPGHDGSGTDVGMAYLVLGEGG